MCFASSFIIQVFFFNIKKVKYDHVSLTFKEIIISRNFPFCASQLLLPGTVPSAGQPKPVWKHDDEQLRQWSRSRTNGPDARTEAGPDGHEPYGNGKNANGS